MCHDEPLRCQQQGCRQRVNLGDTEMTFLASRLPVSAPYRKSGQPECDFERRVIIKSGRTSREAQRSMIDFRNSESPAAVSAGIDERQHAEFLSARPGTGLALASALGVDILLSRRT